MLSKNKSIPYIVITIGLILFSNIVNADYSGYYSNYLSIGEQISNLKQSLALTYQDYLNGYHLDIRMNLAKDYRINSGIWNEEDLEFNDYLMEISKDEKNLSLGKVSTDNKSYFLSNESLLGFNLNLDRYNFWGGRLISEGIGLSSGKQGEEIGFNYLSSTGDISYRFQKELGYYDPVEGEDVYNKNHYLSYNRDLLWKDYYLSLDTVVAADNNDSIGEGVSATISSDLRGINYTLTGAYKSPGMEMIESRVNLGYGQYDLSARFYKRLGSFLIQSSSSYLEDNLNNRRASTNRKIRNSIKLNYYDDSHASYHLLVNYQIDLKEDILTGAAINKDRDTNVSLAYKGLEWKYNLNMNQAKEFPLTLVIEYDPQQNYKLSLVSAIKYYKDRAALANNTTIKGAYYSNISNAMKYIGNFDLSYNDFYSIALNQGLSYAIAENHKLNLALDLKRDLISEAKLDKRFICNYIYTF